MLRGGRGDIHRVGSLASPLTAQVSPRCAYSADEATARYSIRRPRDQTRAPRSYASAYSPRPALLTLPAFFSAISATDTIVPGFAELVRRFRLAMSSAMAMSSPSTAAGISMIAHLRRLRHVVVTLPHEEPERPHLGSMFREVESASEFATAANEPAGTRNSGMAPTESSDPDRPAAPPEPATLPPTSGVVDLHPKRPPIDWNEAIRLYVDEKLSFAEVARRFRYLVATFARNCSNAASSPGRAALSPTSHRPAFATSGRAFAEGAPTRPTAGTRTTGPAASWSAASGTISGCSTNGRSRRGSSPG